MNNLARGPGLGDFIMDKLHRHSERGRWRSTWGKKLKEEIDLKFKAPHVVDPDLIAPWLRFVEKEEAKKEAGDLRKAEIAQLAQHALNTTGISAADMEVATRLLIETQTSSQSDLERIQQHVEAVFTKHKNKVDAKFSKLAIERRQDFLRELSRDFATGPPGLSIGEVGNFQLVLRRR
jgi:hypothetical protein